MEVMRRTTFKLSTTIQRFINGKEKRNVNTEPTEGRGGVGEETYPYLHMLKQHLCLIYNSFAFLSSLQNT